MKKRILKLTVCCALTAAMIGSLCACGSSADTSATTDTSAAAEAADTSAPEETTDDTAETVDLAGTTWTAEVGEDYGAATQEDSGDALTSLTLHFDENGSAYNVVGDVSFDYTVNEDGTIAVSNLNVGDTAIDAETFELSIQDGQLVLNTKINDNDATLTFEQEATADITTLEDTTWTTDVGEDYGASTQEDSEEALTTLTLHFDAAHAYNVVGDISFDYELNEDGTITVSNLDVGSTYINADVFELSVQDGQLVLNTRINGGNATLTFEQE